MYSCVRLWSLVHCQVERKTVTSPGVTTCTGWGRAQRSTGGGKGVVVGWKEWEVGEECQIQMEREKNVGLKLEWLRD